MKNVTLNNGVEMPMVGFGTYQIAPEQTEQCVCDAIHAGYRSIDTAWAYFNEEGVGAAIANCGVAREELFVTSKIWVLDLDYEKSKAAINESLRKLGTDYLDLMLMHQPFHDYWGAWRALEEANRAGKVRAIGVANFPADRLIDLCKFVDIVPAINQIETHVFCQQSECRPVMEKYGVQIESWGPFAEGRNDFFNNPLLNVVAARHDKTTAQVALRFLVQSGVVVIPKSVHKERMAENLDIFDFELTQTDMEAIRTLDKGESLFHDIRRPEIAETMTDSEPDE